MATIETTGFWARQWARLRYLAETVDMSAAEIQDERIGRLERAVADLQLSTGAPRQTTIDRERDHNLS